MDSIGDQITQLMPGWDVQLVTDVEYLPGGYSNANHALNYDGARYVLRIPQSPQPFVDREHEQAWYNALPDGIGVKPVAYNVASGRMLSPWVEGELLIDAWPNLSIQDLAEYLSTLHTRLPTNSRDYDLATINAGYWQDETPPHHPATNDHWSSCHNDLNPWNILVTDNGWVTLDWEFAANNDPLFDLVSLHQGLELPPTELLSFARLYQSVGNSPDLPDASERLARSLRAFWIRELGWARFQLKAGNDRGEIRLQFETASQTLAVLDDTRLW